MRTIETTFNTFGASMLLIGLKGESNATEILIDCADALEEYQGTMAAMSITGPDGTVYPGDISLDENGVVHWVVAERDCGIDGHGSARVDLVDDNGTVVASAEADTMVIKTKMQNIAPDQIENWTDAASVALQEVRAALVDLIGNDETAVAHEAARQLAETGRVSAETLRASAETSRASAETARATAETARASAETARATAETARATAESERASAETARIAAETARVNEFSTMQANAQAALSYIGPSEASSTASAAHAAGRYFIYNGKLYQATADIDIGDTITSGTNCAQVPGGAMGEVSNLKSAITQELIPESIGGWESGVFTPSGNDYASTSYIRNQKKIGANDGIVLVTVSSIYEMRVFAWNGSTCIGTLKTDGTFGTTAADFAYVNEFNCAMFPDYLFKFAIRRKTQSTDITTSEGENVKFNHYTDKTLAIPYKAADSEEVGRRFAIVQSDTGNSIANLIDYENLSEGYRNASGSLVASKAFLCGYMPCEANKKIYTNIIPALSSLVTFYNSSKGFVSAVQASPTKNENYFIVPNNSNIAYFSYPIPTSMIGVAVFSETPFSAFAFRTGNGIKTQVSLSLYSELEKTIVFSDVPFAETYYTEENDRGLYKLTVGDIPSGLPDKWYYVSLESTEALLSAPYFHYMVAYSGSYAIAFSLATSGKLILRRLVLSDGTFTNLAEYTFQTGLQSLYYTYAVRVDSDGLVTVINVKTGDILQFSIKNYIDAFYTLSVGICHSDNESYFDGRGICVLQNKTASTGKLNIFGNASQWNGKKWFAYGTSLTTEEYGHWVRTTANALGLDVTNRGYAGGALVANRNIYNRIMDDTDGKADADIITFEFGANDRPTPLGTIDAMDNTTILGAANVCLKHIFETCPKAQVVIMPSLPNRYVENNAECPLNYEAAGGWTRDDLYEGIRKLAQINGAHFAPFGCEYGIPYFRAHIKSGTAYDTTYIADQIHPTPLGGYNIAQEMIRYIMRIPVWYTSLPQ